jgi:uncharacterized membrane protein YsdA (DUF1294 family)/cold shock CspA family protein
VEIIMRFEGVVKIWNDDRGFGFIEPRHGGDDIFVHIKAFVSRSGRPDVGQRVTFEVEMGSDRKKCAKCVEVVRNKRQNVRLRNNNPARWGTATLFAIPAFFVLFAIAMVLWKVPGWVGGLYLGMSVVCFVVYVVDKSAAEADRQRVREDTLLGLGLVGGWPGAIVAQQVLRHKSIKGTFRSQFWATVIVNILGFLVLSSPLRSMLFSLIS